MLAFAFMSNDGATWDTRAALDALASVLEARLQAMMFQSRAGV